MMQITEHTLRHPRVKEPLTLALAADLHNGPWREALPALQRADAILILGDLVNRHRPGHQHAEDFLRSAPEIAPTFYSIGNHEWRYPDRAAYWPLVEQSDVRVLDNAYVSFRGMTLGALSSAPKGKVDASFLRDMEKEEGFRLLMCHQPEYFVPYVSSHDIDLTVSGHAHGGQVQLLGRGIYSPGQGLLPGLTHGWYYGKRLLVSRGMTNSTWAPRLMNPCELILLHLEGEEHG